MADGLKTSPERLRTVGGVAFAPANHSSVTARRVNFDGAMFLPRFRSASASMRQPFAAASAPLPLKLLRILVFVRRS